MASVELRMSFPDVASLEREIAQNLKHGRGFLPGVADAAVLSDGVLVLVHPEHGAELRLPVQIVMVSADGPARGTGVQLQPFNAAVQQQLTDFACSEPPSIADYAPAVAEPSEAEPSSSAKSASDEELDDAEQPEDELHAGPSAEGAASEEHDDELGTDGTDEEPEGASSGHDLQSESKQEKLRHLTATEQLKVARKGDLSDRLAVERLYGKQVWDALLHNPRLTMPEVARIARKGTVPKPLLDLIIDNGSWINAPQVRRALLGNPKLGSDAIHKLLRLTPKHELKLIEKGTAYSMPVREAARKLLKQ